MAISPRFAFFVAAAILLGACSSESGSPTPSGLGAPPPGGTGTDGAGAGTDGDGSMAGSDGMAAEPTADFYTCVYVNPFNNAQQCKQYTLPIGDETARAAAEADCTANPVGGTIDQGAPGFFATGQCDTTGAVGYCTMPDGSQDYVFNADCSTEAPSAKWGCEDQGEGVWTCLDGAASEDTSGRYTCVYTNPFNSGEQCKEYPLQEGDAAGLAAAEQDCMDNPIGATIDVGDPGTFTQGTCDRTGAVGYCLMPDNSTDFVFEGDCTAEAPSAKWGCEDQAGGSWICLDGTEEPVGDKYTCTYVNPFNSATQCKEYTTTPGDSAAVSAAEQDCMDNPIGGTIDQGDPGTFEPGECSTNGSIGYCIGMDASRDYVFEGDCAPEAPSAKWGCEDQAGGIWICTLDGDPNNPNPGTPAEQYHCDWNRDSGGLGSINHPICREYGYIEMNVAQLDCDNNGGTLSTGPCARTEVVGHCPGSQSNDLFYEPASCGPGGLFNNSEIEAYCANPEVCSAPPEPTPDDPDPGPMTCDAATADVITCRYTSNPFGPITAQVCIDFVAADGWTVAMVDEQCRNGGDNPTTEPAISGCNTCLEEKGGTDRCVGTRASDGRSFYAYDTPQIACDNIEGGVLENPPHAAY